MTVNMTDVSHSALAIKYLKDSSILYQTDFKRQNPSIDVRFWRLKSVPVGMLTLVFVRDQMYSDDNDSPSVKIAVNPCTLE